MKKEHLRIDGWLKEVAPSADLRSWFGHESEKWEEFCLRYGAELADNREAWGPLLEAACGKKVTLLFSAHDLEHNNAVALKSFLEARLSDACGKAQ